MAASAESAADSRGLVTAGAGAGLTRSRRDGPPRRRIEATLAVSFAALAVAALSLLLVAEALTAGGGPVARNAFVAVLLALFAILMVAVVNLQLASTRRRAQARDARLREAIARLDGVHGFSQTLATALEQVQGLFDASGVALAIGELETGRAFLWRLPSAQVRSRRAAYESLDEALRGEFLFDTSADAWLAERQASGRFVVLALTREGLRLKSGDVVSEAALERLSQRLGTPRFAGLDVRREGEWLGRIVVTAPGRGPHPEDALRLAQRFVHEMSGALHSRFMLGRLRARVGAMERARIARDLHDSTIQSLVAIEMELELLRRKAQARGSPAASELSRVKALVSQEILDLRDTMQRLTPLEMPPSELVGFLDAAVARFERESGIHALFDCSVQDVELAPRVCREIATIVREALQNVRKHSRARNVLVRFERTPMGWRLVVDDDGQGFPFEGTLSHARLDAERKGPYVIKERVQALGGELTIVTAPGRGARLEILLRQEVR